MFWYRRLYMMSIVTSVFIITLHFLPRISLVTLSIGDLPVIDQAATLLAAFTILFSIIALKWQLNSAPDLMPLISQTLLWITVVVVTLTTGGLGSPLLALWVPAVIFTGLFGKSGLLPVIIAPLGYAIWLYSNNNLTIAAIISIGLIGILPVMVGYLIFSHISGAKKSDLLPKATDGFYQVSNKSETIINAIADGVVAINNQGVIELVNPAAEKILGWSRKDAVNLMYDSVLKLFSENLNEINESQNPITKALATNHEQHTNDLMLETSSGRNIALSIIVSPAGQLGDGVIVIFRDITSEKAEEREQAEFISTASHEMRTPVASIEGYLGLALNPNISKIDNKAREYITKAHNSAGHLGRLFQDLLDITKIEDGRLSNNPKIVEVVDFVQTVAESLESQAKTKGLNLVFKPNDVSKIGDKITRKLHPVFYANVDNDHLREIIANLIENAIKYTPRGTVSVDVSGNDKAVSISVEDTGIGIPNEDISHLFQKFYRVDNSDTREIGGTGLGLFLTRRLVESMEGRISVESKYQQGSTFTVEIPRISHQEAMQIIELSAESNQRETPQITNLSSRAIQQDVDRSTPNNTNQNNHTKSDINTSDPLLENHAIITASASSADENMSDAPTLAEIEKNPEKYLSSTENQQPSNNLT